MPSTAYEHFKKDAERAEALTAHSRKMRQQTPKDQLLATDVLRSAWMFSAGALDAYFCDAYTWVVGGTLIAKDREANISLPKKFLDISLPVTAYLAHYQKNDRWRWRMAARKMMSDRSMLNLGAVENAFNPFLPNGQKLFNEVIVSWVASSTARQRIFGIAPDSFDRLTPQDKNSRKPTFVKHLRERFDDVIFQRRHDCIHNCDRPRNTPQALRAGTVGNVIRDSKYIAKVFNSHLDAQFPAFLRQLGFSAATVQAATN